MSERTCGECSYLDLESRHPIEPNSRYRRCTRRGQVWYVPWDDSARRCDYFRERKSDMGGDDA